MADVVRLVISAGFRVRPAEVLALIEVERSTSATAGSKTAAENGAVLRGGCGASDGGSSLALDVKADVRL